MGWNWNWPKKLSINDLKKGDKVRIIREQKFDRGSIWARNGEIKEVHDVQKYSILIGDNKIKNWRMISDLTPNNQTECFDVNLFVKNNWTISSLEKIE